MSTPKNTAKGIRRQIKKAQARINREITGTSGTFYGAGLAGEGYAGGYRQALSDVLLLLNGVKPDTRGYWEDTR